MKTLLAVLAIPAAVLVAAPAHADEASFQQYLNNHQINIGTLALNPSVIPSVGQEVCTRLHTGTPRDQVVGAIPGLFGDAEGITTAAQHELCPDTL